MDVIKIKQHLIEKAKKCKFNEENHTYHVDSDEYISVTTLLKRYTNEFDSDGRLARKFAKKNGISVREQKQIWEDNAKMASDYGTEIHKIAEDVMKGHYEYYDKDNEIEMIFKQLKEQIGDDFLLAEQLIYNEELKIAGTIDLILYHNGKLILVDYKTNSKPITKEEIFKYMKPPVNHLADNNYNKYSLQLNLYKHLLELEQLPVSDLQVLHVYRNPLTEMTELITIELEFMKNEIEMIIDDMVRNRTA